MELIMQAATPAERLYTASQSLQIGGQTGYIGHLQVDMGLECQRQSKIVRKRQRNYVIFRRGVTKLSVSLLEKSVNDLLFLAHKFLAFFQPVGLTLDVNDSAVMQDTIQDGGGNGDVGKDLIPLRKGLVGGEYGGGLLIPPGDELEEQIGPLNVHRKVADFVNNEHSVLGQNLELVRQTVFKMSSLKLLNS